MNRRFGDQFQRAVGHGVVKIELNFLEIRLENDRIAMRARRCSAVNGQGERRLVLRRNDDQVRSRLTRPNLRLVRRTDQLEKLQLEKDVRRFDVRLVEKNVDRIRVEQRELNRSGRVDRHRSDEKVRRVLHRRPNAAVLLVHRNSDLKKPNVQRANRPRRMFF